MGRRKPCQRRGTHACHDVASHHDTSDWLEPVGYVAHVSARPSPSALPPRRAIVMAHLAYFRCLPIGELYREANRLHERAWRKFRKRRDAAIAALSAGERARVERDLLLIGELEKHGLVGRANEIRRGMYRRLGLEHDARGLEEIAEAYNSSLDERLHGGQLGGTRARVYRFADCVEPTFVAKSGVLAHNRGQGHLSFTLLDTLQYKKRPVVISLGLTSNVMGCLIAVPYRSLAFSAPGSQPAFMETLDGTKSWRASAELEVRLRTPMPVRGLDLKLSLRVPIDSRAVRSLRRLCGRRKVTVSPQSPPYL